VSSRLRRYPPTVGAVILFLLLTAAGFVVRQNDLHGKATTKELCVEIEKVKAEIRYTIQRSIKSLPTVGYYKSHPAELKSALEANRQILRTFAGKACR